MDFNPFRNIPFCLHYFIIVIMHLLFSCYNILAYCSTDNNANLCASLIQIECICLSIIYSETSKYRTLSVTKMSIVNYSLF